MTLDVWLSFCLLELLVCLSPGPAVLFITATSAAYGTRMAATGLLGILLSNGFYFFLSAMGVAAILLASATLYTALQILGGAYLIYLGITLASGKRKSPTNQPLPPGRGSFTLKGFLMQSSNPKALAYFVALLPQFINPDSPVLPQILLLAITSLVIESTVMSVYIMLSAKGSQLLGGEAGRHFRTMAGWFMVYAGCRLIFFDT